MRGGTFLRGEDGSLYFLRDEILDACKVEGDELERATQMLDSDGDVEVEGFAFSASTAQALRPIKYIASPDLGMQTTGTFCTPDLSQIAQTAMCPW